LGREIAREGYNRAKKKKKGGGGKKIVRKSQRQLASNGNGLIGVGNEDHWEGTNKKENGTVKKNEKKCVRG